MTNTLSLFLTFGLLALTGCATMDRPAAVPAVAQAPAPAAAPITGNPALWVVKDEDTTIYLFGSVHVLKPGTVWFDDEIKAAFDASDTLVLELVEPPQAEMMQKVAALAIDPDGPPLSQKLAEGPRAAYLAAMTQNGLPAQAFETFEPWMTGITLSVAPLGRLGYSDAAGVEKVLTEAAKAAGKPVEGLETAEQQLGYFDTLPEAQQIAFLNATVEGLPTVEKEFADLIAHWEAGKPDDLAEEMNASLEATPELAQVLLYDRNANWARWIKARLDKPGKVFIAVGAGHLAGKKDVQDQLELLGIKATRIGKADFGLK